MNRPLYYLVMGDEIYPWVDVEAARRNRRLQRRHPLSEAEGLREGARSCPLCGRGPGELAWLYFESPKWTWEHLCGRAGWMTVCDDCHEQVEVFTEIMS